MKLHNVLVPVLLFGASVFATEHETEEHSHKELPHYVALKAMYTFGEKYTNEDDFVEDGDSGYGVAIDFGHRLPYGFAVEIDFSYETADVTGYDEATPSIREKETATYYTSSLDIAYVYEATHSIGLLAKVGYEFEHEEIADETNNDTGVIFAAGAEYSINPRYKALLEYETSTVEGPKGDMIYVGVMYNF